MPILEVPLNPQAQAFEFTVAGFSYSANLHWCDPAQCWIIDLADKDKVPILNAIPLVTGANLLEQFDYLQFGFEMYAQTDNDPTKPPTFANLGATGHLYVVTP